MQKKSGKGVACLASHFLATKRIPREGDMVGQAGEVRTQVKDDVLTVCAISLLAEIVADVVHEGLGHAAVAFLMGAESGVLSTVAWSSVFDSRLVAAGGTLANLAAGLVFWV